MKRALVADLCKGLVFDKKLKKGAGKMLKGVQFCVLMSHTPARNAHLDTLQTLSGLATR